jgi:small acid-soluble spore protein D (minor alpha/beta-type SASP)
MYNTDFTKKSTWVIINYPFRQVKKRTNQQGGFSLSRRNRNRLLVPESADALNRFKTNVMKNQGYDATSPEEVKFEVAENLGIPLTKGYNGGLEAKDAGKIGGQIGGNMVKEMIRLAQEKLSKE